MSILRLYLTEHWPANPACDWATIGADGRATGVGHSDPRHWPAADSTEVVLAGTQTVWHRVRLPKSSRREQSRLIAYALEDRLLQDPEQLHVTVTDRDEDEASVLVIARERLRQVVTQLETLCRAPARTWSELETISPSANTHWNLCLSASHAVLQRSGALPVAFDAEGSEPPGVLNHAIASARVANQLPAQLIVRAAPGLPPGLPQLDAESWGSKLGIPVEQGSPYHWHEMQDATNLLHDEFRPKRSSRAWLRSARPALWLLGTTCVISAFATIGGLVWQRHQLNQVRHNMQTLFQAAFPNQPIVDPAAQMRSRLNEIRRTRGQLGDTDLLAILSIASEAGGAVLQRTIASIQFERGRLTLQLTPDAAKDAGTLIARFRDRGLRTERGADDKLIVWREELR